MVGAGDFMLGTWEYYLSTKKERNLPFYNSMHGSRKTKTVRFYL